jgi:hypothetical protein
VATGRGRSRRVSLPGVAELLRPAAPGPDGGDERQASGREKHTQKITVYLSAEELFDLERARLALLRYGATADRGRIVREAIAVLLADLDARGRESLLAHRIASENKAARTSADTSGIAGNVAAGTGVSPAVSAADGLLPGAVPRSRQSVP